MPGRAPGRPSLRPCARPRPRSFRPSFPLPFPCLRWLEGTPLPSAFGSRPGVGPGRSFGFQETHLKNAFLALLDELANFLSSLASNLFVERGAVLVAHGFAALSPPELATLAADLLVEADAALVANALATLPASFRDRHAALSVATGLAHLGSFPAAIPARAPVGLRRPAPASSPGRPWQHSRMQPSCPPRSACGPGARPSCRSPRRKECRA